MPPVERLFSLIQPAGGEIGNLIEKLNKLLPRALIPGIIYF